METTAHPAPGEKTLAEILADLRKPVPARLIVTKKVPMKKGGSYEADYVPHTTVRDLLDYYAPGWSAWSKVEHHAGKIYVVLTLKIRGSDGEIVREGIGNEDDDLGEGDYGDSSSNASAMALRRAAMSFGLGRDLWRKK